jgi:hypothetical protein
MHIEVYGDDTRAFFKDHVNLVNIDTYILECGLKSDLVLPNMRSTKFKYDRDSDIDFLKRKFDEKTLAWNHKKMFDKWLYQSKNRDLNDQILVVLSYLQSVPTDEELKKIVKLFIKWVTLHHSDEITYETYKVIDSVNLLLDGEIDRTKKFKYEFGNQYTLRGYEEQIMLHSFSSFRYKTIQTGRELLFNYNISKHLVLYFLGLDIDNLKEVSLNDFSGVNRPPPIFENDKKSIIRNSRRFYYNDYKNSIKTIATAIK